MEKHFVFDINQGPDGKMIAVSLSILILVSVTIAP
jgi:hypothetical protein